MEKINENTENFENEIVNKTLLGEIPSMQKTEAEIKYTKELWGHIPQIPVTDNEKVIGLVQWRDNICKARDDPNGHYCSIGVTKLENGSCVMMETINGRMYAYKVSDYAAIIFIINSGEDELLDKFELREKAVHIISNEFKLAKSLNNDVYKSITEMSTMEISYRMSDNGLSLFEEWDSIFGIDETY